MGAKGSRWQAKQGREDEEGEDVIGSAVSLERSRAANRKHNLKIPEAVFANIVAMRLRIVDIGRCAQVCKTWRRLVYRDDVWRMVAQRELLVVEGNVPAKEVRRFVAKSLQSFPVRVVTLFSTMYGVCLSGDTVFKARANWTVGDFLKFWREHPENRQPPRQLLFPFTPDLITAPDEMDDLVRKGLNNPPPISWPFSKDDWGLDKALPDALQKGILDYLKPGAILAQHETCMCD